jgi:class 3 adenylate cyclase/tetratricopeptide (TPR) repeat protein
MDRFDIKERPPAPDASAETGAALYCDVHGFTQLSMALKDQLGRRMGAEELHRQLRLVFDALLDVADAHGGTLATFSGDAATIWFARRDAQHSPTADAFAMAMQVAAMGGAGTLPLRMALVTGQIVRRATGDPAIGPLDLLAGSAIDRLIGLCDRGVRGEIVICEDSIALLGLPATGLRQLDDGAMALAIVGVSNVDGAATAPLAAVRGAEASPLSGPAEIRTLVALFVLLPPHLDGSVADAGIGWVQAEVHARGGLALDVSTDDKGTYLACIFGAPTAHEDDLERAFDTALALRIPPAGIGLGNGLRIGLARGSMLFAATGAAGFRPYLAVGATMNLAARLMMAANPGEALTTDELAHAAEQRFGPGSLGRRLRLKGIDAEVAVRSLTECPNDLGPEGAARRGAVEHAQLIERDRELGVIHERIHTIAARPGSIVAIEAPPGLGKTSLMNAARALAMLEGVPWLYGRGEDIAKDQAYLAWRPVLRELLASGAEFWHVTEQHETLIWVAEGAGPPPGHLAACGPAERALRVAAAVTAAIEALSRRTPLVLAFDDCQWIDTTSLALLKSVAASGAQVLVLVTRRAGSAGRSEEDGLFEDSGTERLVLRRLSDAAIVQVARDVLGVTALAYDIQRLVAEKAGGSPMFAMEIARSMRSTGMLSVTGGFCSAANPEGLGRVDFLENIEAAIIARCDKLPEEPRRLLRLASVLGTSFDGHALGTVLGGRVDASIGERLDLLVQAGFLEREEGDRHAFAHPLIAEALYQSLTFERRREAQLRLAEWWKGQDTREAAHRRARSLRDAADHPDTDPAMIVTALDALAVAAQQAASDSANLEASLLFEDAIRLARRLPPGEERERRLLQAQALHAFSLAVMRGYGDPTVETAYRRALNRSHGVGASSELTFVLYGLMSFYASRGDYTEAIEVARQLARLARTLGDAPSASIARQSRAIVAVLHGRTATAASHARRSVEIADAHGGGRFFEHGGTGDFRVFSLSWLALAEVVRGRWSEAVAATDRAAALTEGDPFGAGFMQCFCPLPVLADMPRDALHQARRIISDAETRGFALFGVIGRIYEGWAAARLGLDDGRAGTFPQDQLRVALAMGLGSFAPLFLSLAAEAHALRNDIAMAQAMLDEAREAIGRTRGHLFTSEIARCAAVVAFRGGATPRAALLHAEEARRIAQAQGMGLFELRALDWIVRNMPEHADPAQHVAAVARIRAASAPPQGYADGIFAQIWPATEPEERQ